MSTITILGLDDLNKAIRKIGQTGKALQYQIHQAAVSALVHIQSCGDTGPACRLLTALPSGQRVKALANWNRVFSGDQASFTFDKSEQVWTCKLAKKWKPELFDIDGAMETTYGDLVPEKGYDTLSVAGVIAFLKRKANEDGKHPNGEPKVAPEARQLLAALYVEAKKGLVVQAEPESEESLEGAEAA